MPSQPPPADPVSRADDAARALARDLMAAADHAALAVIEPATGDPAVSRIAFGLAPDGRPMTLISALAPHFAALQARPVCSLMVGEPGPRGDPLTHPRLMVKARAEFADRSGAGFAALRDHYLAAHPKARLYADFADFSFVVFTPLSALLNGGFARAYRLQPEDLAQQDGGP